MAIMDFPLYTGSCCIIHINTKFDISWRPVRLWLSHCGGYTWRRRLYAATWLVGGQIHFQNWPHSRWLISVADWPNNYRRVCGQNAGLLFKKGQTFVGCNSTRTGHLYDIDNLSSCRSNTGVCGIARRIGPNLFEQSDRWSIQYRRYISIKFDWQINNFPALIIYYRLGLFTK